MLWALVAWVALARTQRALRLPVSRCSCWACSSATCSRLASMPLACWRSKSHRLWPRYTGCAALGPRRRPERVAAAYPRFRADRPAVSCRCRCLLMMSPTRALWNFDLADLHGKIDGALAFVVEVYSHEVAFLLTVVFACAAGWALRRRALSFHGFGLVLLAIGGGDLHGAAARHVRHLHGDQRLPIALAFILVACIDVDLRNRVVALGLCIRLGSGPRHTGGGSRRRLGKAFAEYSNRSANRSTAPPRREGAGRLCGSGRRRQRCAITASCTLIASPSSSVRRW